MRFSEFIQANLTAILDEWDAFAKTLLPVAATMSDAELRDHAREVLLAICEDMEVSQTDLQRSAKSKQMVQGVGEPASAAANHGGDRQQSGFNLMQLVGEFRALRASVLGFWSRADASGAAKPAAEEIARFNESLDQALAQSVERYSIELAKSRDMFLAVLGHDVRGPLSGITVATEVLLRPSVPEPTRNQVVLRIRRAAQTINRLTTDLLEYTRNRLGRGIPVEKAACDLRVVCEEAIDDIRANYPQQPFEQHLEGDLQAECDVPKVQQVLANLLHNAVQHGTPSEAITLQAVGKADVVMLRVKNSGRPIPPEALRIIFEPLVQVPSSSTEPSERSSTSQGLGLFIAHETVRGHGGTISVTSSAEFGTEFTVELPRNDAQ